MTLTFMGAKIVPAVLDNQQVKELLADTKTNKFDLIIVESFGTDALYGLGGHFNAPIITVSATEPTRAINDAVGNPETPSYVPNVLLSVTSQEMTFFFNRLKNYSMTMFQFIVREWLALPGQEEIYNKYFSDNPKPLRRLIKEDVALAFVNTHFSFSFPRPYVPNMIEIGGIHIDRQGVGDLPGDIQAFLDAATEEGVILFSMGSILQASDFSEEQLKGVISTLGRLQQKVIWRYNLPDADQLPGNILTKEWLPQQKILAHANVKLFVTHGGMLGTTESVYNGKPMVGIPVFGDQHLNMARAVHGGYAIKISLEDLSDPLVLFVAIQEILSNTSYTSRAVEVSGIYRDQPMSPQDTVLFWCEHVMRHKGAKHMQVQGQNLGFLAYHGMDGLAFFVVMGVAMIFIPSYLMFKWVKRNNLPKNREKSKEN